MGNVGLVWFFYVIVPVIRILSLIILASRAEKKKGCRIMLIVFCIYLVIVFAVGVLSERRMTKSEEGYFLGDRNFGPWATAISAGATDTSGWIFIGAAGYAYSAGISTMWMLPGFIVGYLINWFGVAPRLRKREMS